MLGPSPWTSVFTSVKWGIRMFKKIHKVSNYYGILPRRQCWTNCPFRKTVTPVLSEQIYPWKHVGVFWTAFREETWPGNSAASQGPGTAVCTVMSSAETPHWITPWSAVGTLCMYYSGGSTPPCKFRYFISWDRMGYRIQKILVLYSACFSLFHLNTVLVGSQGLWAFHGEASSPGWWV